MTPLEVLLQLGTVFLGAFLAFGLENLRERRQLRGWANDYLRRVRSDLAAERDKGVTNLEGATRSFSTFLAQDDVYKPSENEWYTLLNFSYNILGDHRTLLESPAVRTLPAEIVTSLSKLDERRHAEEVVTQLSSSAWQTYAVPLVLRQTQMTAEERRGLEYVQELFRLRLSYVKERAKAEGQVLELLNKYDLGR